MKVVIDIPSEQGDWVVISVDDRKMLSYKRWDKQDWRARHTAVTNLIHIFDSIHVKEISERKYE